MEEGEKEENKGRRKNFLKIVLFIKDSIFIRVLVYLLISYIL
jgi:hypothetical protein